MMHPLIVCGPPTSGKVVLTALLEGHPQVFSFLSWHDNIGPGLGYYSYKPAQDVPLYDLPERKLLPVWKNLWNHTHWNFLEIFARQGWFPYHYSSSDYLRVPLSLDFYALTKTIADHCCCEEALVPRSIFSILFSALYKALYKTTQRPQFAVSEAVADFYRFSLLFELYPEARVVYMQRDITQALYTTIKRSSLVAGRPFTDQIEVSLAAHAKRIKRYFLAEEAAHSYAQKHPEKLYIIPFDELIMRSHSVITSFCDWAGFETIPLVYQTTWLQTPLGVTVLGTVNDDFSHLSQEPEMLRLRERLNELKG